MTRWYTVKVHKISTYFRAGTGEAESSMTASSIECSKVSEFLKCVFQFDETWASMKGENRLGDALSSQALKVLESWTTIFMEGRKRSFWLHICYCRLLWQNRVKRSKNHQKSKERSTRKSWERDEERIQSGKQEETKHAGSKDSKVPFNGERRT